MKEKRVMYDGYFTVEASFIVPIAFFLIILTLQYGFFCYEKSVSLQCCYLAALRASNEWDLSEAELEKFAKSEVDKLLEERNLYPVKKESSANITWSEVKVETEAYMETLFGREGKDDFDGWDMSTQKCAGRIVPSNYIRRNHMVTGGGKDGSN